MRILLGLAFCVFSAFSAIAAQPIANVSAIATSAQVEGIFSAKNVCNENGLTPSDKGDGLFKLTTNGYADGGSTWHSGYRGDRGADEHPIIQFDLSKAFTVGPFRVWNHNGSPHRGFKRVMVTYSLDGKQWQSYTQPFEFTKAPGNDDYTGETYAFNPPITARYIRLHCDSTHRSGGQPDLAGLGKVRFYEVDAKPHTDGKITEDFIFPAGANVVNVKAPPYLAKGDGTTDDTEALQRAINDTQGTRHIVVLPAGTYLVSRPLRYEPGKGHGYNNVRGESREKTILRLADNRFTDPANPQPVLSLAYNGQPDGTGVHADWFNCNVGYFTIDTGSGNPGAIGLQYYSNNVGSLRDVRIASRDQQGTIGLDLGYADQNGPLLVKNVQVAGFAMGVRTGATVNSQTLEHISITGATKVGWENAGQCLAIRDLQVKGSSLALHNKFGVVTLVDAELRGDESTKATPAIQTHETLFARNISTHGFQRAIENKRTNNNPTPDSTETKLAEYVSTGALSLFPNKSQRSLNLPVEETPELPMDAPASWANIRHFREMTDADDSAALQRAIDSGATTVFFPAGGNFKLGETVEIRSKVRRITGMFANVRRYGKSNATWRIGEGESPVIVIEQMVGDIEIDHAANRTLIVRDGQGTNGKLTGNGKLFLENVVADWTFEKGHAWARQLNNEREGLHILNQGATLWILGYKTERGGTLIDTRAGATTELLGGFSYTTTQGKLAPMFVSTDARVSYVFGEVCYTGEPFRELIRETRGSETKILKRGDAPLRPAFLQGSELPLYVGQP